MSIVLSKCSTEIQFENKYYNPEKRNNSNYFEKNKKTFCIYYLQFILKTLILILLFKNFSIN